MKLETVPHLLAVCRLESNAEIPNWALQSPFFSVTRSDKELSVVCLDELVPEAIKAERGWSALRVAGALDFQLTGILSELTAPLAKLEISIFAISTFDTDYLLVKQELFARAVSVLREHGYEI